MIITNDIVAALTEFVQLMKYKGKISQLELTNSVGLDIHLPARQLIDINAYLSMKEAISNGISNDTELKNIGHLSLRNDANRIMSSLGFTAPHWLSAVIDDELGQESARIDIILTYIRSL